MVRRHGILEILDYLYVYDKHVSPTYAYAAEALLKPAGPEAQGEVHVLEVSVRQGRIQVTQRPWGRPKDQVEGRDGLNVRPGRWTCWHWGNG